MADPGFGIARTFRRSAASATVTAGWRHLMKMRQLFLGELIGGI